MTISKVLLRIAVFAYVVSLVVPTVSGGQGLIFAIWGFLAFAMARVWALVWLANPAFIAVAWLTHKGRHPVIRRLVSIAGVVFALSALRIDAHQGAHDGATLQVGYWIWLGAIVLMMVSTFLSPSHTEHPEMDGTAVAGEASA